MNVLAYTCRALALTFALAASVAVACPVPPNPNFDEQYRQRRMSPILQGVGYDASGERVFISACRRRAFACDLLTVDLNGPPDQEAMYLRGPAGRYGYVWPAVSPDGRFLAAVRAPRNQRPTQRNVTHDLVQIDLQTGEERVLASAGDGRFERVVFTSNDTILAVRFFRSGQASPCTTDGCTDLAEILLVQDGRTTSLPVDLASFRISIVPLGVDGPFLLSGPTRTVQTLPPGNRTASSRSWVVEAQGRASAPAERIADVVALLAAVERRNGSLGGWPQSIFTSGVVGMREGQPFCGTRAELAPIDQTVLVDSRHGVFVAKVRISSRVRFEIGRMENRGSLPWALVSESSARYPIR